MKLRTSIALVVAGLILGACSSSEPDRTASPSATVSVEPSASPTEVPELVGTWTRMRSCRSLMRAAKRYDIWGPDDVVGLLEDRWYPPTVTSIEQINKDDPCRGTLSVEHSHFFTVDGLFGSLDENGEQVDDGTYELINDHTFLFGPMKIHYDLHGDSIRFRPLVPDPCSKACLKFLPYAIGVFYPGTYQRTG